MTLVACAMDVLLLPGMDGTGDLFTPFVSALPSGLRPHITRYPADVPLGYDELLETITVPNTPFAITAESFSGPLAVMLAARYPSQTAAVILVGSFVRSPTPLAQIARLAGSALFRVPLPRALLRLLLLGFDASDEEVDFVHTTLRSVEPRVLARRVRAISEVDVSAALTASTAPLLYLSGSRDRVVGPRPLAEILRLRPDTQTATIGAPHLMLQRNPGDSARICSDFIDRECLH